MLPKRTLIQFHPALVSASFTEAGISHIKYVHDDERPSLMSHFPLN